MGHQRITEEYLNDEFPKKYELEAKVLHCVQRDLQI